MIMTALMMTIGMISMIYKIIAIGWLICGFIDYKICLATLQSSSADDLIVDRFWSLAFSFWGPVGLILILSCCDKKSKIREIK